MRTAEVTRNTTESKITLSLDLDGNGSYDIQTECGFLNHMLELFTRHGEFNLSISCTSDTHVDYHHTVEDIGIVLGRAFQTCLGDCMGICRYGSMILPMDEALILAAVDISGRCYCACELEIPTAKIGDFDSELVEEFLLAFSRSLGLTLHIKQLAGKNSHHIVEGTFKALARALKAAVQVDEKNKHRIPSTKGTIL